MSIKVVELSNMISDIENNGSVQSNDTITTKSKELFNFVDSCILRRNRSSRSEYIFTIGIYKKLITAGYLTKVSLQNATLEDLCKIKGIGPVRAKMILMFANNDFKTVNI